MLNTIKTIDQDKLHELGITSYYVYDAFYQGVAVDRLYGLLTGHDSDDWGDDVNYLLSHLNDTQMGFDTLQEVWVTLWLGIERWHDPTPGISFDADRHRERIRLINEDHSEVLIRFLTGFTWDSNGDLADYEFAYTSLAARTPIIRPNGLLETCYECGERYSGDRCTEVEGPCGHCGDYYHGDPEDHLDGCTDYGECDCETCMEGRYGDTEDDQGWTADVPEVPQEAPEGRRRFGIEVEFNGSGIRSNVVREMLHRGVACAERSYTHDVLRYWKLIDDGSVTGGEVVSPIMLGDDASIEEVLETIRSVKVAGGKTGSNCGMHVHIDVTDFNNTQLKTVAVNMQRAQRALEAFCAESRFNGDNSHCERYQTHDWEAIHEWMGRVDVSYRARTRDNREFAAPVGRYHGFNFNSLLTYGSIEIRLLGHTLNTVKVKTWIRVCQALFVASARGRKIRVGTDFIDWLIEYGELDEWSAAKYREVVTTRHRNDWLAAAV
jgi:hypothetical protein